LHTIGPPGFLYTSPASYFKTLSGTADRRSEVFKFQSYINICSKFSTLLVPSLNNITSQYSSVFIVTTLQCE